jgi:hypothetical protein
VPPLRLLTQRPPCRQLATGSAGDNAAAAAATAAAGWPQILGFTYAGIMQGVGGIVALLGGGYLAILALLVTQQRSLIFPATVQPASSRDHRGGKLVTLPAGASEADIGTTLAALFFPPPEPSGQVRGSVRIFLGCKALYHWGIAINCVSESPNSTDPIRSSSTFTGTPTRSAGVGRTSGRCCATARCVTAILLPLD